MDDSGVYAGLVSRQEVEFHIADHGVYISETSLRVQPQPSEWVFRAGMGQQRSITVTISRRTMKCNIHSFHDALEISTQSLSSNSPVIAQAEQERRV
jgi:hypothetical protein